VKPGDLRVWLYNGRKRYRDEFFIFLREVGDNTCEILCDGRVMMDSTAWILFNSAAPCVSNEGG